MAWKFSRTGGEISAAGVEYSLAGIKATLKTPAGDIAIQSALVGPHNLENILAAAGMALGAGFSRQDVKEGLARMKGVPGRMERIESEGRVALVDYAHSDDALKRSLEAARTLARGRVVVVFGCGGDRDKGKRPIMGQVAAENADLVVVTSDNPRTEDPDEIIGQITAGVEKAGLRRMSPGKAKSGERGYLVDADRRTAIELGASLLKEGDVMLVAGKGHEGYQNRRDREATLRRRGRGPRRAGEGRRRLTLARWAPSRGSPTSRSSPPPEPVATVTSVAGYEGVSTDSRTLTPGALFVALRGERFDAHAFLADVAARGAAGAVVQLGPPPLPGPARLSALRGVRHPAGARGAGAVPPPALPAARSARWAGATARPPPRRWWAPSSPCAGRR